MFIINFYNNYIKYHSGCQLLLTKRILREMLKEVDNLNHLSDTNLKTHGILGGKSLNTLVNCLVNYLRHFIMQWSYNSYFRKLTMSLDVTILKDGLHINNGNTFQMLAGDIQNICF